jgi:hypothetical protein
MTVHDDRYGISYGLPPMLPKIRFRNSSRGGNGTTARIYERL